MCLVLLHLSLNRHYKKKSAVMFKVFLLVSIVESSFNVASCLCINSYSSVPRIVNLGLLHLFFFTQGLCYYVFFLYTMQLADFSNKKIYDRAVKVGTIPYAVYIAGLLFATKYSLLFVLDDNGVYRRLPLSNIGFSYIIIYFILDVLLVYKGRHTIPLRKQAVVYLYVLLAAVAVLLQLKFSSYVMTGFARSFVIMFMYLSLQNPDDYIDRVTGTGNESAFELQMNRYFEKDIHFTAIIILIKNYQAMEGLFGFDNLNKLLDEMGHYLVGACGRQNVFRTSFDTFSIIAVGTQGEIWNLCKTLNARFMGIWCEKDLDIIIDSGVIAIDYPEKFGSFEDFVSMKSYLIKTAREMERGSVLHPDKRMTAQYMHFAEIERSLALALATDTLSIAFQPVYSEKLKRANTAEALVRLYDSKIGSISPEEFIPMSEQNGSVVQLGKFVIEEVCRFIAKNILPHPEYGLECVNINVSAVQCMQPDLVDSVMPVIEKYRIPPGMISFEITEQATVTAPDMMLKHMKSFMEKGIRFVLDDYGSGNSNANYLVKYPFQKVKIDKELIWDYFNNGSAKIILTNQFNMIEKLGLPVVAEGIETSEQYREIRMLGVESFQGFYFAKPMGADDFVNYLKEHSIETDNIEAKEK